MPSRSMGENSKSLRPPHTNFVIVRRNQKEKIFQQREIFQTLRSIPICIQQWVPSLHECCPMTTCCGEMCKLFQRKQPLLSTGERISKMLCLTVAKNVSLYCKSRNKAVRPKMPNRTSTSDTSFFITGRGKSVSDHSTNSLQGANLCFVIEIISTICAH